ncbi:uncharacterized protein TRAVEDRAFT_52399 [Trametes versicolor FP-101664 SS1]|uniref:uncharacterized protein n=1 Tax=Trametes versicolor (strain FP-101664) TaxID=717944 RepID=UPI000462319D|nr:uncharacterized protein TRAVEDRAFT_52399 [Trametes versicolor FP-101664 SS1]EIW53269.1 hypothetical protein TRAVEDRAFT_52399 [Trametes versicolor FP-101664 SS1]
MAAENAGLSARVETMSAQMATMSAQMATVLAARLEDPPAMQGPYATRDSRLSKRASLRNRRDGRCVLM